MQVRDSFEGDGQSSDTIMHFRNKFLLTTVSEIMGPITEMGADRLESSLKDAMWKMVALDLVGLPVVDNANQIIGFI